MPVDLFMKYNMNGAYEQDLKPPVSLFAVMDIDEYDDVYGITDGEPFFVNPKSHVYSEMNKNKDRLVILYECCHPGQKVRHHSDYSKPLEVELICRSCHSKRHPRNMDNGIFFTPKRTSHHSGGVSHNDLTEVRTAFRNGMTSTIGYDPAGSRGLSPSP